MEGDFDDKDKILMYQEKRFTLFQCLAYLYGEIPLSDLEEIPDKIKNSKFKKVQDSYPLLAQLELYSADGLINYADILKYGAVNPKTVLERY